MRKIIVMMAVGIMTAISAQAQKIQAVDDDGHGIPLVSVTTEDGVFIGTTDINGTLADVKGATKVSLAHVAYKPQTVSVSALTDGRVVMEEVDYDLGEIVVKPKPYVYMEYYFRGFSYIDDSLRTYAAGIIPVAHDIKNGYKGKTRSVWTLGGAANKALKWNIETLQLKAEEGAKQAVMSIEESVCKSKKFKDYYKVSMEPDGENRWLVKNPEGTVGVIKHDNGQYRSMLDGSKIQMYANKANGETKRLKDREDRNYDYQYSEVFNLDDEGNIQPHNLVMDMSHWEYDTSKGRKITIIYLYTAEHSYMDDSEFKARTKELNKGWVNDMPLEELQKYEQAHNIPALAPTQLKAIEEMKLQTGKKK